MGNHIKQKTNFCGALEISYNCLENKKNFVEAATITLPCKSIA